MRIHIGTSGWAYPHWRGVFYPDRLPDSAWLGHHDNDQAGHAVQDALALKAMLA